MHARACLIAAATCLVLVLGGCAGGSEGESESKPASGTALVDLRSVDQLRTHFNEKEGVARLILVLAPT
ncbi:MAG: hypothetical protein ACRDN6_07605 [Gaiellaceae bacterium]